MIKLNRAMAKALEIVLALLILGGVLYNLDIVIEVKWWQVIVLIPSYLAIHNIEKLYPKHFKEDK